MNALGNRQGAGNAAIANHISWCADCREQVTEARKTAALLHSLGHGTMSDDCLSDDAIAEFADNRSTRVPPEALSHISECAYCRSRLAATARLLADHAIASEIGAVQSDTSARQTARQRWSRSTVIASGSLVAAAAAAIVLLAPIRNFSKNPGNDITAHREVAITTTAAPRILSPLNAATLSDSLRWTAIPEADLYRVRVWDQEGTVVWSTETHATALPLPSVIQIGKSYLWEVGARTGWDRWVSSDFVEFTASARQPH